MEEVTFLLLLIPLIRVLKLLLRLAVANSLSVGEAARMTALAGLPETVLSLQPKFKNNSTAPKTSKGVQAHPKALCSLLPLALKLSFKP